MRKELLIFILFLLVLKSFGQTRFDSQQIHIDSDVINTQKFKTN